MNLLTRIKQFFAPAPKLEGDEFVGLLSKISEPGLTNQELMCCLEILWIKGQLTEDLVVDLFRVSQAEAQRLICDFYSQIH